MVVAQVTIERIKAKKKVIIFAGAGASAKLGMPTTPQFIAKLQREWPQVNSFLARFKAYRGRNNSEEIGNTQIDAEEFSSIYC
ncbi:hypothetical protein ACFLYS_03440 [Chloroflexota bacterium]